MSESEEPTGEQGQVVENQGLKIERPGAPGFSQGQAEEQSEELPEEYRSYKDVVPWEKIPEDAREEALKGIKTLHGEVTRRQQEAAELRKQLEMFPELQEKGKFFDYLYQQPEIQNALQEIQRRANGQTASNTQPAQNKDELEKLSELGLDRDVSNTLAELVEKKVQQALNPVTGQLSTLQQQLADKEVREQLANLSSTASEKGLPDPKERLNEIRTIIADRRAMNVADAYFLSIQDKLPELYAEKAKKEFQDTMKQKANRSLPPGSTPPQIPTNRTFMGRDAIENALRASEAELNIKL